MAQQVIDLNDLHESFRFIESLSTAASVIYSGDGICDRLAREGIAQDLIELVGRISSRQSARLGE